MVYWCMVMADASIIHWMGAQPLAWGTMPNAIRVDLFIPLCCHTVQSWRSESGVDSLVRPSLRPEPSLQLRADVKLEFPLFADIEKWSNSSHLCLSCSYVPPFLL